MSALEHTYLKFMLKTAQTKPSFERISIAHSSCLEVAMFAMKQLETKQGVIGNKLAQKTVEEDIQSKCVPKIQGSVQCQSKKDKLFRQQLTSNLWTDRLFAIFYIALRSLLKLWTNVFYIYCGWI
eukprot:TRINITY_DN3230_c0_g1_i2.p4 TRINITY_DN3230_c0_g1~~TRINITY_DN3230_c0_g1_i2.p4  ORF type:complete len:125 (-),score=3.75 TRINITY_DN3230_c0_g1_i2:116-490(-)